jgi:uncharacterized protein YndB with AHSA1/START domain
MDTTTAQHPIVQLERIVPASPAEVYRAWLDPELIRLWLAPVGVEVARAEVDERAEGHYRIWHEAAGDNVGGFECELLELVPDRRIVFRWGFVGPERDSGPVYDSLLTLTFEDAPGDATKLTLVHERLESLHSALPEVAENVEVGWKMALDKLATSIPEAA